MLWLNKIKSIFVFSTLAILPIFLSCNILDSNRTGQELSPIEGNIIFFVHESYQDYNSVGKPRIILGLITEKIYPCFNYEIIQRVKLIGNRISVNLAGIYISDFCLTALGPASSSSFLDIPAGEYSLNFSYKNVTDRYSLTVTDSSIKLTKLTAQFTKPKFELYWRYPANSLAYLCGTTTATSWIYEDFLDTLLSKIHLKEFQFPDSGVMPYPRSSQGHYYDAPAKYFYYETEEDFDNAGEILKTYSHNVINQYEGIGISLIGWNNKKFYSWLFQN